MLALTIVIALADPMVTKLPITGGRVTRVAFGDSQHVYAATTGPGQYASSDGGATWTPVQLPGANAHVPTDLLVRGATVLTCEDVPSAAIVHADATGTEVALRGTNLRCLGVFPGATTGTYYASVVDRSRSPILGEIYKSIDDGRNWTLLPTGLANGAITEIVQLPTNRLVVATRLFAADGTLGAGTITVSDNDGMSFQDAHVPGATLGIAYNGTDTLMALVAGSTTSVMTSTDGSTWGNAQALAAIDPSSAPLHRVSYRTDAFVVQLPATVVMTGDTTTGYALGTTNLLAGIPVAVVADAALDPADATHIVAGDAAFGSLGAYATTGGAWAVGSGFVSQPIHRGFIVGTTRYALGGNGLYDATNNQTILANARAATIDASNPTRVVASVADQLYVIADINSAPPDTGDHAAWTKLPAVPGSIADALPGLLANGNTLYVGVAELTRTPSTSIAQYLSFTMDLGADWMVSAELAVSGGVKSLAFDPTTTDTIYAGIGDVFPGGDVDDTPAPGGLAKSTDGGITWTPAHELDGLYPRTIIVDPNNAQRVWALAQSAHDDNAVHTTTTLFASTNGGDTWVDISPNHAGDGLAYDPVMDHLYTGSGSDVLTALGNAGSGAWTPFVQVPAGIVGIDHDAASLLVSTSDGVYEIALPEPVPDLPPNGDVTAPPPHGCCGAGGDGGGAVVLAIATIARRRRR